MADAVLLPSPKVIRLTRSLSDSVRTVDRRPNVPEVMGCESRGKGNLFFPHAQRLGWGRNSDLGGRISIWKSEWLERRLQQCWAYESQLLVRGFELLLLVEG